MIHDMNGSSDVRSKLDRHLEMVGRTLALLVANGLARVDLSTEDASIILKMDDSTELRAEFGNIIYWMISEGLVREGQNYSILDDDITFCDIQLTSRGLAVLQSRLPDTDISIADRLSEDKNGSLTGENYAKLDSLVGGILGGFAQSFS